MDTLDDPPLKLNFDNDTSKRVQVWLEPFCHYVDVDPDHRVSFRAAIMGDPNREPTELAGVFQGIADRLNGAPTGPELEIGLSEAKDGSMILTLWLDETDNVGCGEIAATKRNST